MRQIILIVHNIRSCHNVGSLLRTSDGLSVNQVYLTGYTPYPAMLNDERIPHIKEKIDKQIKKTSLGAEKSQKWTYEENVLKVLINLEQDGWNIVALEQSDNAILLPDYKPAEKLALIVGSEVEGIESEVLQKCNDILEIPMSGEKESFNVSVAAAIALYQLKFK